MTSMLQRLLDSLIRTGSLEVQTASGGSFMVGDGSGPPLAIRFKIRSAELRFLRDPELALGELYMDGAVAITQGELLDVLELGLRNIATLEGSRWMRLLNRARVLLRRMHQNNDRLRAKSNVSHHYDIDDRLYSLFLDADRQYSCAYFEDAADTLDEAQLAKKRHIAAKLLIEPGQSALDIGCGWGGMGLYLAAHCGARVTGVTSEALDDPAVRAQLKQLLDDRGVIAALAPCKLPGRHNVARRQQHAGQHQFLHGVRIGTRRVEDRDAALGECRDGHIVGAGTGARDGKDRLGQRHLVHVGGTHQHGVGVADFRGDLIAVARQALQALGADVVEREDAETFSHGAA